MVTIHSITFRRDVAEIVVEREPERHVTPRRIECSYEDLTFMTIGTLLCIKIFRRNAEHIVTLDAHAMKNWLPRCRSLVFRGMSLRRVWFGRHE
jgi:hypothetical protein